MLAKHRFYRIVFIKTKRAKLFKFGSSYFAYTAYIDILIILQSFFVAQQMIFPD